MTKQPHYRELGRVKFIYHGDWADPELIYKKHSFCYYDIEDMLIDMFKDDYKEREKELGQKIVFANEDKSFNKWIKDNRGRCYGALDDLVAFA